MTTANFITALRIPLSIGMLFFPALSVPFYSLYVAAGFTDIIDGTVARLKNQTSVFGASLDTASDTVFALACMIKLLPVLSLPVWLWVWIGLICTVKIFGIVRVFAAEKKLLSEHTVMNKLTGALLFILPLTLNFVDIRLSGSIACTAASFAALQEVYISVSR